MTPNQTDDWTRLGSPTARLALYLPNRPQVLAADAALNTPDVPCLIRHNGNHWRKIFSILAKLCAPAEQRWQDYRDLELLHRHEMICFADCLLQDAQWHLVAGKASWQRLGLDPLDYEPLDDAGPVRVSGNILLTPYPDYRQFSNRTVEQVRAHLQVKGER
ncbi:DUF6942 family protein [Marinobacterium rhizophilum]|uniref:Uncharacterized protein n=1 Tax=Marinobacterium rhizophilum TaxID=420402 RepID=A0ABY5HN33_9GAMM|nr:hypothetical protein [Marinobacterium rhizophilum]UTW12679.1 hypothetical protein KDW95_03070 [Marinobacterium rhizophilum]